LVNELRKYLLPSTPHLESNKKQYAILFININKRLRYERETIYNVFVKNNEYLDKYRSYLENKFINQLRSIFMEEKKKFINKVNNYNKIIIGRMLRVKSLDVIAFNMKLKGYTSVINNSKIKSKDINRIT